MTDSTSPKLTIAIPTFNRAPYLRMNLQRLLEEVRTLPPGKVEVIVSDNHSADDTPEVVAQMVKAGLTIRYLRNAQDLGSDANIAQCFNEARGDYVQIMGDDDLYVRGTLPEVITALEPNDYGVLCLRPFGYEHDPDREYPGGAKRIRVLADAGRFLRAAGALITSISAMVVNRRLLHDVDARDYCGTHLVQVNFVVKAALAARRNALSTHYVLACKRDNSGGYGRPDIFVEHLGRILDSYRANGLTDADIRQFEARMLLSYHPLYLLRQRIAEGRCPSDTYRHFSDRFAGRALFHLWVAPIIVLPRPLALVWGSFATVTGRVLNGDLRRGVMFAWHRRKQRGQAER
ncbi:glycosyltransferase family 2 protein [Trinickia sp.]|uniref:glycosyltransferase family 2 protein n=1 Tax=Trinickia sp. TaxID=2571163 RepID=UPI003F8231B1